MFEFLFELLAAILSLVLEAFLEFAIEYAVAILGRALMAVFDTSEFENPYLACVGYVFLGGVAGALSLLLFPHRLFPPSRFPGISLVVSRCWRGSEWRSWAD